MDSKTKQKLKKVFVPIVVFLSFSSLCIAMLKFYGQCAGQSTCAILVTIFLLHSWFFDREFRSRIMESSVSNHSSVNSPAKRAGAMYPLQAHR